MTAHVTDLAAFVTASPSSYHAASEVARRLRAAGYDEQDESVRWDAGAKRFVVRDGAVVAWRVPEDVRDDAGFRIVAAHTDSPGFKLKPEPASVAFGFGQAGMEVYGGPVLHTWLDREFGLAGRVVTKSGEQRLVSTPPWLRIPQLAPHLDRSLNDNLHLDRQAHLLPVLSLGPTDVLAAVAVHAGLAPDDIDGHDLFAAVAQPPEVIGVGGEFLASGRLDNLSSVHAGLVALTNSSPVRDVSVLACFDHEELGSASRSGAAGPLLRTVLRRIAGSLGWDDDRWEAALARSFVVSADAGHSIHPNYPFLHDPTHHPVLGGGPLLKVNGNQRYTSDAPSSARWRRICRAAGIPTQTFVSNNAVPCGSTVGPFVASDIGAESVDVGVPLLSMHSARELAGVADQEWFARALGVFFAEADG